MGPYSDMVKSYNLWSSEFCQDLLTWKTKFQWFYNKSFSGWHPRPKNNRTALSTFSTAHCLSCNGLQTCAECRNVFPEKPFTTISEEHGAVLLLGTLFRFRSIGEKFCDGIRHCVYRHCAQNRPRDEILVGHIMRRLKRSPSSYNKEEASPV